jgi:hypothetical protein
MLEPPTLYGLTVPGHVTHRIVKDHTPLLVGRPAVVAAGPLCG